MAAIQTCSQQPSREVHLFKAGQNPVNFWTSDLNTQNDKKEKTVDEKKSMIAEFVMVVKTENKDLESRHK